MSESLFTVLNYINEGIIILNEELEILFWNDQMVHLTKITSEQAIDTHLFEVLPRLKQNYLQQAFNSSLEKGYRYFFAAAMHNHLITDDAKCNLRISRFEHQDKKCLMIECVDVTSQFTRIHQLKEYANR